MEATVSGIESQVHRVSRHQVREVGYHLLVKISGFCLTFSQKHASPASPSLPLSHLAQSPSSIIPVPWLLTQTWVKTEAFLCRSKRNSPNTITDAGWLWSSLSRMLWWAGWPGPQPECSTLTQLHPVTARVLLGFWLARSHLSRSARHLGLFFFLICSLFWFKWKSNRQAPSWKPS